MIGSTLNRIVGTTLPCAPVTVLQHAVAPATLVSYDGTTLSGAARFRPANEVRTGGQVSRPEGATAPAAMISGPIFDDDKSTGASVPGRRGGT